MIKGTNLVKYVLVLFVPSIVCAIISAFFGLELRAFTPMIAVTSIYFADEILAEQRGEKFIWKTISNSTRDKIVFAVCYMLFWIIVSLPLFLKMKALWIVSGLIIGYLASLIVFKLLARQSMKVEFPKITRFKILHD